ncbi:hypothetical protein GCM10009850_087520 [Nonomuraea monospora]|uniref:Uncharacterized protein n=1 Tax=Nonomuraea monospora TaxID=568818 RepID=A0ABP5PQZ6_9ACTN
MPTVWKAGWIASVTIVLNQPFNAWLILQPKSSQPHSSAPPSGFGAGSGGGSVSEAGAVGLVLGSGCGGGVSIGPVGAVGVAAGAGAAGGSGR